MLGDRRSLMQEPPTRYLAMAPEVDDGRHRIIVDATNAVEYIFSRWLNGRELPSIGGAENAGSRQPCR